MSQLKKVRDSRRTDLEYVLIESQDFNSEFHAEFEVVSAAEPEIPPFVPDTKPIDPKPRKLRKEDPNTPTTDD